MCSGAVPHVSIGSSACALQRFFMLPGAVPHASCGDSFYVSGQLLIYSELQPRSHGSRWLCAQTPEIAVGTGSLAWRAAT